MLKYAVLIRWRKKGVPANFYAFCISAFPTELSAAGAKRGVRRVPVPKCTRLDDPR